ncbi:MAG: RHS repeat-associated core domain-containing protein [Candidatus Limnocylindria bacterium]
MESISNDEVTYSFTHDEKNRLKSRTDSRFGRRLVFDYDAADRVIRKTDYQGDVTEFQYDSTGRLVAERNAAYLQASYHYDGDGRLLNRILSNGSQSDYSYDAAGRLSALRLRTADGTLVHEVSYDEYDAVGNLKQAITNQQTSLYSYDAVHRLLAADLPGSADDVSYSYDPVGNRKTEVTESGSRHYLYGDGNRLLEIREQSEAGPLYRSFTYSDAGEIESKRDGAGSLLYGLERSSQGRVAGVSGLGFSPQTLGYDPLGLRVRRTVSGTGGANQRFHLEGEHLEAIYTAAGALRAKFLRGSVIDEVVNGYYYLGPDFEPTNYTYHHDPLQSVVGISSPTGSPTQTLRYGPFGTLLASSGTSSSTLRYTGREHDSLSGLYYYRARYYDPEIGRFLSEDPMGFGGGDVNLYAYVGNNPISANDPRGDCPQCAAGAIVGAAGGLLFQVGADVYHGRPSSPAQYAGAVLGGAAGGVAAVTCGAACAGAIGGAVGNTTTQFLEGGGFSAGSVIVDAAIGAVGGKVLGEVVPTLGKKLLSNQTKKRIGEYLTELDLRARGNTITGRDVPNYVGKSDFDFGINGSQFAEAKFGTSTPKGAQREAIRRYGESVEVQYWTYDRVSGLLVSGPSSAYAK